jgi:PadR family transcriptional regulator, regulatory protein PadR
VVSATGAERCFCTRRCKSSPGIVDGARVCRLARMGRMTWQTQAILSALPQDTDNPHYGLEMGKAAGLASGTIYPILARLERAGWVESELEDIDPKVAGRRARRYYRLTAEGKSLAGAEISNTLEQLRPAPAPALDEIVHTHGAPSR